MWQTKVFKLLKLARTFKIVPKVARKALQVCKSYGYDNIKEQLSDILYNLRRGADYAGYVAR